MHIYLAFYASFKMNLHGSSTTFAPARIYQVITTNSFLQSLRPSLYLRTILCSLLNGGKEKG
ncbi:hypothetical protein BGX38DRAFT_1185135 [Terfezia claveryi]|nr:hypothetical protein BGX38DRAFT_1185135 [Terfezia claveryi]